MTTENTTILVIKGIVDPVYIMAARTTNEKWLTYLHTYCEYVECLFTTLVATNWERPVIFIGPHICDLGPKSCPEDRLGDETVSLLDDCLSN